MIRYIRVLGAALGGLTGLVLAEADRGLFEDATYAGFLLAAWVIAWVIVGFAILPYLTDRARELADRARRGPLDRRVHHRRRRPAARPADGAAARLPVVGVPATVRIVAAARGVAVPRARDAGPDRGQAEGPGRSRADGRDHPPFGGREVRCGDQSASHGSWSTPRRSSMGGSPRSSSRASSTARW